MADFPNLAGVATKDLVEKIGSGKFSAAYINWSRTLNLLRTHAPGWTASCVTAADGSLLHRAPVGAYLLIQFVHVDGTETPAVPQAVMDHRNNAIPFEKITARDVTDTQRRGTCMAAAFTFGLAFELWAKLPMESGYAQEEPTEAPKASPSPAVKASQERWRTAPQAPSAEAAKVSEPLVPDTAPITSFREAALEKGVHTVAIDALISIVNDKLGGDFEKGLGVLAGKSAEELNAKYGPKTDTEEQW